LRERFVLNGAMLLRLWADQYSNPESSIGGALSTQIK